MSRRALERLGRDTRGGAAVEFAFLAPLMILLYFGMVEFCQSYMALKRTGHAAAMVADLVSQTDATTPAQIADVFAIGDLIMSPFSTATLKQRVSSVTRTSKTAYKVDWSQTKGMTEKLLAADADIPDDMLANGESVIIAETFYDYRSAFTQATPGVFHFKRRAYLRPRTVEVIPCTGC
ncbi:TadE/TadG family type IV pilus assembly protein [Brevundimonas sp. Marseille-Q4549]